MVFGVSMKGLIEENVAQISHCARDTNFKHFALLLIYICCCLDHG